MKEQRRSVVTEERRAFQSGERSGFETDALPPGGYVFDPTFLAVRPLPLQIAQASSISLS